MASMSSARAIGRRHESVTRDVLAALTLSRLREIVPADLPRTMPTPGAVRLYLAVTAGLSINTTARVSGCAPSYVRRAVRAVEERRERVVFDRLIGALESEVVA